MLLVYFKEVINSYSHAFFTALTQCCFRDIDCHPKTTPSKKKRIYILSSNFAIVQMCSVRLLVTELNQAKYVQFQLKNTKN